MSDSYDFLTIHSLTALPFHNRNRDDQGAPKQLIEGDVSRGYLSSQSRKRPMRIGHERWAATFQRMGSMRSRSIDVEAVEQAIAIALSAGRTLTSDEIAVINALANTCVTSLTTGLSKTEKAAQKKLSDARLKHEKAMPAGADRLEYMGDYDTAVEDAANSKDIAENTTSEGEPKDVIVWASDQEIRNLAEALLVSLGTGDEIPADSVFFPTTTSLSIAAFGRMMAASQKLGMDAGMGVSPAVTTHAISVSVDWYTAVDDRTKAGAGHINQNLFTSGVHYATVTLDRRQLIANWNTDLSTAEAEAELRSFVGQASITLPQGKKNSTSADTFPAVLIAEQQLGRTGYEFGTPVLAGPDGGFLINSMDRLFENAADARWFHPSHFGGTVVSGVAVDRVNSPIEGAEVVNFDDFITNVVAWLRS
jgi:CRISPR system Cascade subunit CasC